MKWEKVRLGDVADSCLGKMLDQEKNRGEYQPYLANVNVRWGSFDLENLPQMRFLESEEDRYGLKYGDLIVCEGGEPGRCAIWKEQVPNMKFQKALHRVRVHNNVDYRYLFFWFLFAGKRGALDQYFTGATIKHMPGDKLKSIILDLPPLEQQKKIADVLSAYDDLIENNQKQIKLLEEAAQRLYKEWFIDLRFPGHESTPIVNGLPEGWQKNKMSEVCESIGGGTPSTAKPEYFENGTIKWVTPTDLTKKDSIILLDTEKKITQAGLDNSSAKMLPPETVLMTSRASIGYFAVCEHEVCTNQGFIACIPKEEVMRFYLLFNLMSRTDEIKGKATGSTFLEISKRVFRDMSIIVPASQIMTVFNKYVSYNVSRMRVLEKENVRLISVRESLLSKLMNGDLEVIR